MHVVAQIILRLVAGQNPVPLAFSVYEAPHDLAA